MCWLLAGLAAGCGDAGTTGARLDVTVTIDPSLSVKTIAIRATAGGRPMLGPLSFPVSAATGTPPAVPPVEWHILIPTVPAQFVATLEASGVSQASGSLGKTVADAVEVHVPRTGTVAVNLALTGSCLGVACAADQTCVGGACTAVSAVGPPFPDAAAGDGPTGSEAAADRGADATPPGADAGLEAAVDVLGGNQPCSDDTGCPTSLHCTAMGTCVPKSVNGATCATGDECASTFCASGVCCDQACGALCKACTKALTGNVDGTCDFVLRAHKEPQGRCSNPTNAPCGHTGTCDGQGACELPGPSTVCAQSSCGGGSFTAASTCAGGACVAGAVTSCGTSACSPTTGCATKCASDNDCPGGYCTASMTCAVKKTDGQACAADDECLTGHSCVANGAGTAKVCCNAACAGTCVSCFAKDTGGTDGSCQPVALNGSSNGKCPNDGTACGHPGTCDGKGGCYVPPAGTGCSGPVCATAMLTPARTCDGKGTCQMAASSACPGALICASGTACKMSCASDGDCTSGYCAANGACTAAGADGTPCTGSDMCTSRNCASGLCCPAGDKRCGNACIPSTGCCAASDCTGTCQTCSGNVCVAVKNGDDPDSCAGTCDASGACKGKQGQPCPAAGCAGTLSCVEGVCCNGPCGTCRSCLQANTGQATGTCAPVPSGHAHGADCPSTTPSPSGCSTNGLCDGAGNCALWPAGTLCKPASCGSGAAVAAMTCNASGGCTQGGASTPCGAYQCESAACVSTCGSNNDCASGYGCSGTTCVALKSAGAACSTSSQCASGTCGLGCPTCGGTGGRCCSSGAPCSCPQPTASEIAPSPGFDTSSALYVLPTSSSAASTTTWTANTGCAQASGCASSVAWSAHDADLCPFSGSVKFTVAPASVSPRFDSPCLPVTPNAQYDFGAAMYNGDLDGVLGGCSDVECFVMWYENSCGSNVSTRDFPDIVDRSSGWLTDSQTNLSVTAPFNATGAIISCFTGGTAGSTCAAHVDRVYLTPSPSIY